MFDFEQIKDFFVSVGIKPEIKWSSVSLGAVIIIRCKNFQHFPWWRVFHQNRSVIL